MFSCNATKHITNKSNLTVYCYYFDAICSEDKFKSVFFLNVRPNLNFYICNDYVVVSNANVKLSNRVCWLDIDYDIDKYLNILANLQTTTATLDRFIKL
ncbi:MAG: hypothetical protein ACP5JX_04140 [Sulfurihydrogenibium sp.]